MLDIAELSILLEFNAFIANIDFISPMFIQCSPQSFTAGHIVLLTNVDQTSH